MNSEHVETRECALCGEVVCRHDARKQRDELGAESIVCKEPFECLKRVAISAKRLATWERNPLPLAKDFRK